MINSLDESRPPPPPPWTELPWEMTANILKRVGVVDILQSAQLVCSTWWKVCQHPAMWRVIIIQFPPSGNEVQAEHCKRVCRRAVDRSQGQLVDLYMVHSCDDDLLLYIAKRSSHLRRLVLDSDDNSVSGGGLTEAVKYLPELEELSFPMIEFDPDMESMGTCCPRLKSLTLGCCFPSDEYAVAISKFMPRLQHLDIEWCSMSSIGLEALLHGCPHLESLHVWDFAGDVDLGGALGKRVRHQIKHLHISDSLYSDLE